MMGNPDRQAGPPPCALLNPRRILVRGVNWLGDAVMTTPALQRLRERFPESHVTVLTPGKLSELWLHHPAVNETISFAPGEGVFAIGSKVRAGQFDLALVLPNSPRSALEVWLGRIPQRIGYARPWRNWFLTQAVPSRPGRVEMRKRSVGEIRRLMQGETNAAEMDDRQSPMANSGAHQIHEYLHLAAALGARPEPTPPLIGVTEMEVAQAKAKFQLEAPARWLGLVPGAEYGPAKRWPKERFIAAARELQRTTGCGVVLLGGRADQPLAREIEAALQSSAASIRNLAGRTSLRELCAVLKVCAAVLTNDTGPMHLAAAVGTRVVVPFGSTSPELTGPGLPGDPRHRLLKSDAPCSPCFLRECPIDFRCLMGIRVEQVVRAVQEVLNADAGAHRGPR
jgi:heptosyltransferase-2